LRAAKLCALVACLSALAAASAAAGPDRIVILPVVVHSAAADPSYVSRGLSEMLSARLEQLGGVEVVRPADPAAATVRLDEALDAGRRAGGDFVLFGAFTQFGDGASLDVQCAPLGDSELPARSIFIQSGTLSEIIPKLDGLADKVARYIRGELPTETAGGTNGVGEAEEIEDLRRRLEALESAVFLPAFGAEPAQAAVEVSESEETSPPVADDAEPGEVVEETLTPAAGEETVAVEEVVEETVAVEEVVEETFPPVAGEAGSVDPQEALEEMFPPVVDAAEAPDAGDEPAEL
jgi:TolB-like protein